LIIQILSVRHVLAPLNLLSLALFKSDYC